MAVFDEGGHEGGKGLEVALARHRVHQHPAPFRDADAPAPWPKKKRQDQLRAHHPLPMPRRVSKTFFLLTGLFTYLVIWLGKGGARLVATVQTVR